MGVFRIQKKETKHDHQTIFAPERDVGNAHESGFDAPESKKKNAICIGCTGEIRYCFVSKKKDEVNARVCPRISCEFIVIYSS